MAKKRHIELGGMKDSLDRIGIDPMSSMAAGGNTSLFSGGDVVYGCSKYAEQLIPAGPLPDPSQLASDVIGMVITDVTQFAASYIGEQIGDLLSPPSIGDVLGSAGQQLMSYLHFDKDIKQEILGTVESLSEEITKAAMAAALAKLQKETTNAVSKVQEDVTKVVTDVKKWMDPLLMYIFQGPAWVEAQAERIDNMACEQIERKVSTQFTKLKEKKQKFIDGLGAKWAKKQAEKQKTKVLKTVFDAIKKKDQLVEKAKNKAKSVVKEKLFDMKAKLGV